MGTLRTYEPNHVSFSFKGLTITGYQKGTFIDSERHSDGWTMHAGALGDIVRTRNLDRSGSVTLTLMAQASDNDLLQAIADADEQFGIGVGSLQIMDHNGNMELHADLAWIRKRPKIERGSEAGPTVWVFDCAELEVDAGGNVI